MKRAWSKKIIGVGINVKGDGIIAIADRYKQSYLAAGRIINLVMELTIKVIDISQKVSEIAPRPPYL
ncbi:hypothetical protein UFB30_03440 [Jeotgalibacillus sp. HH7-29]|uniref:Uncharacterized protein n=1 Tax=Jeotgalibacillus haloalkalitolerans TaxID=3104292 RepID=A0ABU5KJ60_9BACL|nr:hypothetical protein [Jeotgalibacillus sp. HH7-29]